VQSREDTWEYGEWREAFQMRTFTWTTVRGIVKARTIGEALTRIGGTYTPATGDGAEFLDRISLFDYLGSQGWELVAASPGTVAFSLYFFKRIRTTKHTG
jgi:hypothetical protein